MRKYLLSPVASLLVSAAELRGEGGAGVGLGREGQPEAGALAAAGARHVVSVDVDIGQELQQQTLHEINAIVVCEADLYILKLSVSQSVL